MNEWYENDTFWEEIAPVLFTKARMEEAVTEVEHIVKLLDPPPGASLLDMGCGRGRHSLEFAERGLRVTGVDRTAKYLEIAKSQAAERGLEAEWVRADMREFRRDGAFDIAVNLLTSFGYFEDTSDDRRIMENIFNSLAPGGRFVMDIMGKEILARIYRERDWHEEPDGTILLEERQCSDDWSKLEVRWIVLTGARRCEHRLTLRLYSATDLRALLTDAGFEDVKVYGSLTGTPYDHEAQRLVLVGRKPGRPSDRGTGYHRSTEEADG